MRTVSRMLYFALPFAVLLVLWQIVTTAEILPRYFLPSPISVVQQFFISLPQLVENASSTISAVLVGYIGGSALAIVLGIAIAGSKILERIFYPPLIALNALPKVAIAPLFVIWFGFGFVSSLAMTFLICFFPVLVNTVVGLRSIDPEMIRLSKAMGSSEFRTFRLFRFPNSLPYIFAGLKVSSSLAVIGAVVAEFIASDRGWGHLLVQAGGNLDSALVFVLLFALTAFAMALFYVVALAERFVLKWHSSQRSQRSTR